MVEIWGASRDSGRREVLNEGISAPVGAAFGAVHLDGSAIHFGWDATTFQEILLEG